MTPGGKGSGKVPRPASSNGRGHSSGRTTKQESSGPVSLRHCDQHRIFSPKCEDCQAARGIGGNDRRVINDPLRTDKNWRRMTEIARGRSAQGGSSGA